jgi:hypothetical protein
MKRPSRQYAIIGVMLLGPAFAAHVSPATAASVDAVHQSGLGQHDFGPVVRPPMGIPGSSGHPHAVATPVMSATEQHVREFLEWKDRHAPQRGRFGGSSH